MAMLYKDLAQLTHTRLAGSQSTGTGTTRDLVNWPSLVCSTVTEGFITALQGTHLEKNRQLHLLLFMVSSKIYELDPWAVLSTITTNQWYTQLCTVKNDWLF